MTDKVQKIREGIEKLKSNLIYGAVASQVAMENRCKEEAYNEVLALLDSMQEEPVSNSDWLTELQEKLDFATPEQLEELWNKYNGVDEEELVSEDLEEACEQLAENARKHKAETSSPFFSPTDYKQGVIDGAKWQKEQFEKDYTDLCNGIATAKGIAVAMAYDKGMADAKEQMMAKAIDVEVKVDAGGYPYIDKTIELYDYYKDVPLAKEGDKYKVVLIKED